MRAYARLGALALLAVPMAAQAQDQEMPSIVTFATSAPTTGAGVASVAMADVIGRSAPYQVEVSHFSGTVPYVPLVNSGEVEFGFLTQWDQLLAYQGADPYPHPYDDIRVVMGGSPWILGAVTWEDSGIEDISDIRGKRITGVYNAHPVCASLTEAFLANAGLTEDDVEIVPVPDAAQGVLALQAGRADVATCSLPTVSTLREMEATRGVRFLTMDMSEEGVARAREVMPILGRMMVEAGTQTGYLEDQETFIYRAGIVSSASTPDAVVRAFIEPVWNNQDELAEAVPATFSAWDHEAMVGNVAAVPYHPGAVEFYREQGMWTEEMDRVQQQLVAE